MTSQGQKAERLPQLQQQGSSFLLPDAWDGASARIFEAAGFPAIGATSAGIAFASGNLDGQAMSRDEVMRMITCIAAVVTVSVTAETAPGTCPDRVVVGAPFGANAAYKTIAPIQVQVPVGLWPRQPLTPEGGVKP